MTGTNTNNTRYIIREVYEPDFEFYFDDDGFSSRGGIYGYNIFPILSDYRGYCSHYHAAINDDEFKKLDEELNNIIDEIYNLDNSYSRYKNVKEIMEDYNLTYNPKNAHTLKEMLSDNYYLDHLTDYLTIKTGEKWACIPVTGYCQGDFTNVIYCEKYYTEKDARVVGEMVLGCAKEFSITFVNEGETEENADTVYGYFVADCEAWKDEDYKKIVCGYEGIDPEKDNVTLEMIENDGHLPGVDILK